jgi:hypothetical protein
MKELELLENRLNLILPKIVVLDDGTTYQTKVLIKRMSNLKLHIYVKDHNPPHFHVIDKSGEINATFRIDSGEYLQGTISKKNIKRVNYFYKTHKEQFIILWNKLK